MRDFELVNFSRTQLRVRHRQGHELVFTIAADVWGRREVSAGPLVTRHGGPDPVWSILAEALAFARTEAKRMKLT
ncbi:hypothetical protein MWN34_04065 [Ancylobacter sp. 6x-1]|uniref:Uncharacterized protein n=1 Tax=Ancylobacter crimeensis TaxID=2579147 RepID=A0ABT0D809_9HYPH|nr:hypothetical protein [Ancylobacter crimeensis]MCK0196083.1 hypothetical protein [Ancylobacter crimeensis]